MATANIPFELKDRIVRQLPSNNRAIQSISSVSRVFRQLCLPMLFEEVAITSRHTSLISANILSRNNGIVSAIKRLHVKYLSPHCLKVHGNVFQIISGDNVTLVLHNMDLSLLDPLSAQICFGAFRSIVLQETGYTETILAGILCEGRRTVNLELLGVENDTVVRWESLPVSASFAGLQRLVMKERNVSSTFHETSFHLSLAVFASMKRLETFDIEVSAVSMAWLARVLQLVSPSLVHLACWITLCEYSTSSANCTTDRENSNRIAAAG